MKKEPLVSIIIPTYNRGKYILNAIKSCQNQTYPNIEIIIIDDCSTDNTKHIIKSLKDKRIRYSCNKKNSGAPFTRNRGIKLAKGDFINFLDDDDLLYPNKIELQIKKFKDSHNANLGIVTCHVKYQRDDLNEIKKNNKQGKIYRQLLKSYCVFGTETMLIKTNLLKNIGGFDEKLPCNQEYDLSIRLSKEADFDFVNKVLTKKLQSENQISFNFTKKIKGTKYLYNKYKKEFLKQGILFYTYNYLRYHYLFAKYWTGKTFGLKIYNLLK